MKEVMKNKKGRIIILFFIILLPAIWFFFLNKPVAEKFASEKLTGQWIRYDGTYIIDIKSVKKDGVMEATYFNPNPVSDCEANWKLSDNILTVYVELKNADYKGSNYKLVYDEKSKQLVGIYYQAVAKETYEVYFVKK